MIIGRSGWMMSMVDREVQAVLRALSVVRAPAVSGEYDLHAEIGAALERAGIAFDHEFRLAPRCRIDFLAGRVGIEVKKGRPVTADLRRQVARYAQCAQLDALVVVVQRGVSLPDAIHGKPVVVLSLNRLWGVALP